MRALVKILSIGLITVLALSGCKEENPEEIILTKETVSGLVQKGPFINGTAITISELNAKMNPTGRIFNTEILDNAGAFALADVELASQYVEVKANGYYYNEVVGNTSSSPLQLSALVDLSNKDKINVNALTHLEKSRAAYLVSSEGYSLANAKKQAMKEILTVFSIEKDDISASENLNITQSGEDNAILLAISIILQGERETADFSELLANINTDLREDGILDSENSKKALVGRLEYMDMSQIRQNLENRYQNLGLPVDIPDFEKYVTMFLENTDFDNPGVALYPKEGEYGINVLHPDVLEVKSFRNYGTFYSLAANIPLSSSLKVKITAIEMFMTFAYEINSVENWKIGDFNVTESSQVYEVAESGKKSDLKIQIWDGVYRIDYYENGSSEPSFSKMLAVVYDVNSLPESGLYGANVIHPNVTHLSSGVDYSICGNIAAGETLVAEVMNQHTGSITWTTADIDNWKLTEKPNGIHEFSVVESGKASDLRIRFEQGKYTIIVNYDGVEHTKNLWVE